MTITIKKYKSKKMCVIDLQVEYAMEAVKQGTPVLGLRSKTHVVLVSFKRAQSELAQHQRRGAKTGRNRHIFTRFITFRLSRWPFQAIFKPFSSPFHGIFMAFRCPTCSLSCGIRGAFQLRGRRSSRSTTTWPSASRGSPRMHGSWRITCATSASLC